jgi:hypothetical protein
MENALTLQEQFLLVCLNDDTGQLREGWIDPALSAAAIAELILGGRLELDAARRVKVVDSSSTGDDLLDRALGRIAGTSRPQHVQNWLTPLTWGKPKPRDALLRRLAARGILAEEQSRALGIFLQWRFPQRDPRPERELREQLLAALRGERAAAPRLRALILILTVCGRLAEALPDGEVGRCREQLGAMLGGDAPTGPAADLTADPILAVGVALRDGIANAQMADNMAT